MRLFFFMCSLHLSSSVPAPLLLPRAHTLRPMSTVFDHNCPKSLLFIVAAHQQLYYCLVPFLCGTR